MTVSRGSLGGPARWVGNSGLSILPTLLNELWQGWQILDSGTVLLTGLGGSLTMDQAGYGGTTALGWETTLFTEPYGHVGASATSTVAAARTGWRTPSTALTRGGLRFDSNPILDVLMATGTPSDPAMGHRYWIGLFEQVATLGNVASAANPSTRFCAFRFDSTLGDTTWKGVVRDNGAITVVDTGLAVSDDTAYRLTVRIADGVVTFQVNGANDAVASTNTPTAATLLWPHALAIKDATGVGQILTWYTQRAIVRVGSPTKFR